MATPFLRASASLPPLVSPTADLGRVLQQLAFKGDQGFLIALTDLAKDRLNLLDRAAARVHE